MNHLFQIPSVFKKKQSKRRKDLINNKTESIHSIRKWKNIFELTFKTSKESKFHWL